MRKQRIRSTRRTISFLDEHYCRLSKQRWRKRTAVVVGHSILMSICQMLKTDELYKEKGARYFEVVQRTRSASFAT